jgi:hypothetical protein
MPGRNLRTNPTSAPLTSADSAQAIRSVFTSLHNASAVTLNNWYKCLSL